MKKNLYRESTSRIAKYYARDFCSHGLLIFSRILRKRKYALWAIDFLFSIEWVIFIWIKILPGLWLIYGNLNYIIKNYLYIFYSLRNSINVIYSNQISFMKNDLNETFEVMSKNCCSKFVLENWPSQ